MTSITASEYRGKEKKNRKVLIPEDKIQRQCVTWFRLQYPQHYWRLFSIPNGGKRSAATAAIMKSTGALSGAWDLFLSIPRYGFHGLYIEMKSEKGKLTENQENFKEANNEHYEFKVCYSLEQFQVAINGYLAII